jgi:hypothetical protein
VSKAKDVLADIKTKVFERKKEEMVEEAKKTLEANLETVAYDVIQDPSTTSRQFLIVQIKYDLETKKAVISEVRPFSDKTAGLSIQMNKENIKFLFDRNKRGDKK